MSAASTMARVEGPPEPMTMPVRGLEISSSSSRPASSDRLFHGHMVPGGALRRESAWRGDRPFFGSSVGCAMHLAAEAEFGYNPPRDDARLGFAQRGQTSWLLLPIEDTMPMPVTTTRLMISPSRASGATETCRGRWGEKASGRPAGTGRRAILAPRKALAVGFEPAVGDAEHQLALESRA
jgi:hypothetical protein